MVGGKLVKDVSSWLIVVMVSDLGTVNLLAINGGYE